jgi:hypothetical protein
MNVPKVMNFELSVDLWGSELHCLLYRKGYILPLGAVAAILPFG